jgi:hypothetical protein
MCDCLHAKYYGKHIEREGNVLKFKKKNNFEVEKKEKNNYPPSSKSLD